MRAIITEKVTIVGPMRNGSMRVHAAGCRDIERDARTCGDLSPFTVAVTSKRDVANEIYGPRAGSFYEEAGGDDANGSLDQYLDNYASDKSVIDFAPCTDLASGKVDVPAVKPAVKTTYHMRVDLVIGQPLTRAQLRNVRMLVAQAANGNISADEILDGGDLKAEFFFTARA